MFHDWDGDQTEERRLPESKCRAKLVKYLAIRINKVVLKLYVYLLCGLFVNVDSNRRLRPLSPQGER